jgi:DNA-binding Lrp family transcriptional regulator
MPNLDAIDIHLLRLVQADSSLSLSELAGQVGLSTSPCWRRLKALEASGVIKRQVAILDPKAIGLAAQAYVQISLLDHTEASIDRFMQLVRDAENIVECATISGDADFMIKVVAEDAEALEAFLMKRILALGIVRSSHTNIVLRCIKTETALPLSQVPTG